jgi:hypothetical protein
MGTAIILKSQHVDIEIVIFGKLECFFAFIQNSFIV